MEWLIKNLGRVEVGFQPDPVDYHAINVVVVDSPGGPRIQPAGLGSALASA